MLSVFYQICGVSILRAGETMEQALCDVLKDVRLGKILIQTNQDTGEPEVCLFSCSFFVHDFVFFRLFEMLLCGILKYS